MTNYAQQYNKVSNKRITFTAALPLIDFTGISSTLIKPIAEDYNSFWWTSILRHKKFWDIRQMKKN